MKYNLFKLLAFTLLLASCNEGEDQKKKVNNQSDEQNHPLEGSYTAHLNIQEGVDVNFKIILDEDSTLSIINGKETIQLSEFYFKEDSMIYPLHIFDAELRFKHFESGINGYWVKNYTEDYIVPLSSSVISSESIKCDLIPIEGEFEMTLNNQGKERKAKLILTTKNDSVYGTVMTRTGDYRYLNGKLRCNNNFSLNTFNGESAYRFDAKIINEDSLTGDFYSGKTRHEKWKAVKNNNFQLEDPTQLGSTTDYSGNLEFEAKDLNGTMISTLDEEYKNHPIVVQILGTWCPNCMDEAAFMKAWLSQNPDQNVKIIGLAFELKEDFNYAKKRISKFKEAYDLPYKILFARKKGKENVRKYFPFLDGVIAYPTTIFLDQNHNVVKIHTGFSGPASGDYYKDFINDFNATVNQISL